MKFDWRAFTIGIAVMTFGLMLRQAHERGKTGDLLTPVKCRTVAFHIDNRTDKTIAVTLPEAEEGKEYTIRHEGHEPITFTCTRRVDLIWEANGENHPKLLP